MLTDHVAVIGPNILETDEEWMGVLDLTSRAIDHCDHRLARELGQVNAKVPHL